MSNNSSQTMMDCIIARYNMNIAKKRYKAKCKRKYVTFYPKEAKLYELANSVNFQKLVKDKLKEVEQNGVIQS